MMDDYMFGAVMQDPKIAKAMIERILQVNIRRIEYVEPQKSMKERYGAKAIRLDLYVEDEDGTIYNVEIQTTNKRNLSKRMRYYQSIIDLHILSPGANYKNLRKSYVIFICSYDPFGKGRCIYNFENRCLEEQDLAFGDETVKVVVNTEGTQEDISEELRETLRYLNTGAVSGDASRMLAEAVDGVRNSEERRREYMVMMAREMEIREEGLEEGLQQGIKQGLQKGADLFGVLVGRLLSLGRIDDVKRAADDAEYRAQLFREFRLE